MMQARTTGGLGLGHAGIIAIAAGAVIPPSMGSADGVEDVFIATDQERCVSWWCQHCYPNQECSNNSRDECAPGFDVFDGDLGFSDDFSAATATQHSEILASGLVATGAVFARGFSGAGHFFTTDASSRFLRGARQRSSWRAACGSVRC